MSTGTRGALMILGVGAALVLAVMAWAFGPDARAGVALVVQENATSPPAEQQRQEQQPPAPPATSPLPSLDVSADAPKLEDKPAGGLPSLDVGSDAPRLDGSLAPAPASNKTMADNSFCFVCHLNYKQEHLASTHALEGVGCTACHGDSFAHRNDENHLTPPDVMFPSPKIDTACRECHKSHDVPARMLIARFLERCPGQTQATSVNCTDCHGEHRLPRRTVRWDKTTRELIVEKTE